MKKLTVYTDGGARGNPGPAATGVVIKVGDTAIEEKGTKIGIATNNVAEYSAIVTALEYCKSAGLKTGDRVECFLDSLLVVQQMKGVYKINDPTLRKLYTKAKMLEKDLSGVVISYTHVRRELNKRADELVNQALDAS